MRIIRLHWTGYRVPFRRAFATSQSTATYRYGLLLFVTTDDGIVGIGEASPVGAGSMPEVEAIAGTLKTLSSLLMRSTVPEALHALPRMLPGGARAVLRFGLETAMLDALGKHSGEPVTALLGGTPRSIPVNALIGMDRQEDAVRLARQAVSEGFPCVKLKIGGVTGEVDEELVRAVRAALGSEVAIRADANGAWTADEAIQRLRLLERSDLEYVEQPVAPTNLKGMAKVRGSVHVPIAADESLSTVEDARRLLEAEAADVFIVKAARAGGLQAGKEIMTLGWDKGLQSVVTSSLESGVGVAASQHLACLGPEDAPASGLATATMLEHDLLLQHIAPVNGRMETLRGPGLGIELDMAAVSRYSISVYGEVKV